MMDKREIPCPVCGSEANQVKYEPWVNIQDPVKLYGAASGIPGTQRLVQCQQCGMIYESPRFPDEVILEGYMSSQEAGHDSQYPMRVESFYRALSSLKELLPPAGADILDIGTAGGAFLEAASRFGYNSVGLEPSEFLVKQGKKRGLSIEQGTIDTHSFSSESFDIICLWDVIEHLTEPQAALLKIRPLLRPNGILLINYPDIGTWQAKLAGKKFWWILSVHLHHFNRKTLTALCQRTGFQTFYFQPYWQTLQFGYLLDIATIYKFPFSQTFKKIIPSGIQKFPLPYNASQTTALARIN